MTQSTPRHQAEEVGTGQTLGRPCQSLAPVPSSCSVQPGACLTVPEPPFLEQFLPRGPCPLHGG